MMADYPGHHVHHQRHLKRSSTVASSSSSTGSNLMQPTPPTSNSATTTSTPSRQAFVQRAYEHHRRRLTERDDDADATDVDFDDDDDDEDDEEGDVDDEDDSLREHCGRLLSSNQNKHLLVSNEASPNHGQATPATAAAAVALFADLMASNPSVPATQLLGGSFQFIVQEQAKSMVAIQELQQEVNSLLLFRQAVLAALPHLTPVATSSNPAPPSTKSNQTWTRRKHLQQQQHTFSSLNQQQADQIAQTTVAAAAAAATTSTQHHQIVVDSGFSTEASNASNTSPRSSRFETGDAAVQPAAMMAQPGEKELVQHLERIQQRQARLKKDEDRLLALLNVPPKKPSAVGMAPSARHSANDPHDDDDGDELWRLLDEIQLKSQTLREDCAASSKKKVSFQQVDASTNTDTDNDPMLAIEEKLPKLDGASGKMKLDRDQVAAVLRLTNPVQLQKQLLCALLDNKKLKAQVETNSSESARRDAQWQTNSQSVADQVTALRDENDDLRFQLEEQKIELEGTKARLRMVTLSSKPLGGAASSNSSTSPALTTVRMRASSTQTERSPAYHQQQQHAAPKWSQSTQTTTDNNHEEPVPRPRSFVPRVIDASPKPRASGKFDQGQWVHEEEDRLSVERRSYTSRIPTPIKPTVIPIVSSPSSYSSGTKWTVTSNGVSSPSVRRELPDTPPTVAAAPPTSAKKRLEKDVPQTILMTPVQKSRSSPIVHATSERTRNSPEANNNNNHKMRLSSSSSRRGGLGDCTNTRAPHDEYYDSINANNHQHCPRNARIASPMLKKNRSHNYGPPSPVDSLESNGPYHHYRGVAVAGADSKLSSSTKRGSYSTESSTPPSNSLTSHS